ncbi:MBL fold metallo-hydrolase [Loktanella sp. SALINAS62]|uniref:MBL fold metallo-hydrolase n=1 Tax=Loktanella sp. SALINAS62 TaxID=2706124 RepID=UPI001B8D4EC9|nr:MBL fold metallo-hydrolase [Loktanella sp. SALINAS62]MBS1302737.1 MBL fold metallo-hydrolase [Loktanella sp. SALINAS62]
MTDRVERHSPSKGAGSPDVWGVYDPPTGSAQFVVACPVTKRAALVDIVQDFDPQHYATGDKAIAQVKALVAREGLTVEWVLDTHPHADHLTASALLADHYDVPNGIGRRVSDIAELWREYYNLPNAFDVSKHYARLFADDDTFNIGNLPVKVMLSPGHTLGSITYVIGDDCALVHDTLMQPDRGTARCDFPGGSAAALWRSIQDILALGETTRLFVGHDYPDDTRSDPQWEATIADHLAQNIHVSSDADRDDWIATRESRDATLPLPDRMLAALQINLRAGNLPPAENDGHHYVKIPLNKF